MCVSVKRGDTVVVLTGKDKGKKGKVISVDAENGTCIVEGVNIVVKHKKARSAQQKSSREKMPHSIHVSNVQVLCKCGKRTRVSNIVDAAGKKTRVCMKCKEALDSKYVKPKATKKKEKEEVAEDKDAKKEAKPLQRREVKSVADSKVKKPAASASKQVALPRKIGGS